MASADNKTKATDVSVDDFLAGVKNEQRRFDGRQLVELYRRITGEPPVMWGPSIIGFGKCHYKYDSGREGDMGAAGFSPGVANLTVYLVDGVAKYEHLLATLGPHKVGKVCVYLKRLSDIDLDVLEQIIRTSYEHVVDTANRMRTSE